MTTKRVLTVFTFGLLCMFAKADDPVTPPIGGGIDTRDLVFTKKQKPRDPELPIKPKAPGMPQYLHGSYSNGVLTVEFPSDAEMGTVTIGTGDFTVFAASIDSADPTVQLPPLSGSFILSVAFDNGEEYEGEIEI